MTLTQELVMTVEDLNDRWILTNMYFALTHNNKGLEKYVDTYIEMAVNHGDTALMEHSEDVQADFLEYVQEMKDREINPAILEIINS